MDHGNIGTLGNVDVADADVLSGDGHALDHEDNEWAVANDNYKVGRDGRRVPLCGW